MPPSLSPRLAGCKILVLEDEFFLACDLAAAVEAAGGRPLGPVNNPATALALLEDERPDLAIIDMNLHGASSLPVAQRLRQLGVPFLILSGYEREALPEALHDAPLCLKPVLSEAVTQRLAELRDAAEPAPC